MTRPRLTVAEVIRSCLDEFLGRYGPELTPEQRRALKDLSSCRTAALGGHVLGCPECGHQQIAYNSCGNRHCPTCQATAAARWLEARAAELLPTPYFHLANRHRQAKLALCRRLLGAATAAEPESAEETRETRESPSSITPTRVCPVCGAGRMIVIKELPPMSVRGTAHEGVGSGVSFDSS
jgi:ribosomal protein L37AE/L43A